MATFGVLHPGAMGAAVAAPLVDVGQEVVWAAERRSRQTAERARRARLEDTGKVASLLALSCGPNGRSPSRSSRTAFDAAGQPDGFHLAAAPVFDSGRG